MCSPEVCFGDLHSFTLTHPSFSSIPSHHCSHSISLGVFEAALPGWAVRPMGFEADAPDTPLVRGDWRSLQELWELWRAAERRSF